MDYYYFIVDEVGSSDKADLRTGIRVFMMPEPMAFPPVSHPSIPRLAAYLDDGEGPYESIRQLKENSELFQALQKADPKRAAAIFEKRFLIGLDPGKYALYESTVDDEFHKLIYPLLLHTVVGSIRKNDVSGVHYFDPERIRVERLVSFDEQTKVWQAHIKVYNPNRDKWIPKRDPATFFPIRWSYSRIITECEYAYLNRVELSKTKYIGITHNGVPIVFIFDAAGMLKTVYPVCEEF